MTRDQLVAAVEAAVRERGAKPERNGESRFHCPEPAKHQNNDEHPSARWNPAKQTWFCDVCRAGGGVVDLAKRVGITAPRSQRGTAKRTVYRVCDADERLVAEHVRVDHGDGRKECFWRRNGKHGLGRLRLETLPLYGSEHLRQVPAEATVVLVEGEKTTEALRARGLHAVGTVTGASRTPSAEVLGALVGHDVVLWPDADEAGRGHMEGIAARLVGLGLTPRWFTWPEAPPKGDAADFAGSTDELRTRLAAAAPLEPRLTSSDELAASGAPAPDPPHLTDLGNAQRLVQAHARDLRYCAVWRTWLVWDGRRWARDATLEVARRAKATVRHVYHEAVAVADDDARRRLVQHALRSESAARIEGMVKLAQSEPGIPVMPRDLDADPWLLNVLNGTLDLRTGTLRPHRHEDLITKLAPVEFDPAARSDVWEKFLSDATGGDGDLEQFLQRAAGYSLTGDTSEEKLFFVHGPEAAGKSTFIEAEKGVLGDYAATADFETFLARRDVGGPRNDVARLAGARFVASIEVDEGKRLAQGLVKQLTGGDTVAARFLYEQEFEFKPAFKLWLAANHAPKVSDADGALWRRILRVPFEHAVPKERQNPRIKATLTDPKQAGSAILAWALAGLRSWRERGLGVPPVVEKATAAYRAEMDPLKDFFAERCVFEPAAWVRRDDLSKAYQEWLRDAGEEGLSRRAFNARLRDHGCQPAQRRDGEKRPKGWDGIRLRSDDEPEPEERHRKNPVTEPFFEKVPLEPLRERGFRNSPVTPGDTVTPDDDGFGGGASAAELHGEQDQHAEPAIERRGPVERPRVPGIHQHVEDALAVFDGATVQACRTCGGTTWRRSGDGEQCVSCHA